MNYLKEKNIRIQKKELLEVSNFSKEQKEELIIEFIGIFLQCLNMQIKEEKEKDKIVKLIYKFRYFKYLPFNSEKNINNVFLTGLIQAEVWGVRGGDESGYYSQITDIEYVDKVIKYYIGRFKSLARSADKQIEKLTV